MRKRERSHNSQSRPPQDHSRRSRPEPTSLSSSLSSVSDSVQVIAPMSAPNQPDDHAPPPSGGLGNAPNPTVATADTVLDPHLEAQLEALELPDDFRDSLRAMSPDTRREVLNDIIRDRQFAQFTTAVDHAEGHGALYHPHGSSSEEEDEEGPHRMGPGIGDFGEYEDDDNVEYTHYTHDDGDEEAPDFNEVQARGPAFGLAILQQLFQGGGLGGLRAVHTDELGNAHVFDPSALFGAPMAARGPGGPGGPGGAGAGPNAAHAQNLLTLLHNLVSEAQQDDAMRRMGITEDLDDMSYEQLLELEERMGSVSKGLHPSDATRCLKNLSAPPTEGACPICLESWVPAPEDGTPPSRTTSAPRDEAPVELRHCHHVFHDNCIRQWLKSSKQCPVCAQDVVEGTSNTAFTP